MSSESEIHADWHYRNGHARICPWDCADGYPLASPEEDERDRYYWETPSERRERHEAEAISEWEWRDSLSRDLTL